MIMLLQQDRGNMCGARRHEFMRQAPLPQDHDPIDMRVNAFHLMRHHYDRLAVSVQTFDQ